MIYMPSQEDPVSVEQHVEQYVLNTRFKNSLYYINACYLPFELLLEDSYAARILYSIHTLFLKQYWLLPRAYQSVCLSPALKLPVHAVCTIQRLRTIAKRQKGAYLRSKGVNIAAGPYNLRLCIGHTYPAHGKFGENCQIYVYVIGIGRHSWQ